jgi:hypothetical protein
MRAGNPPRRANPGFVDTLTLFITVAFFKYLKTAFGNHWNLLAFFGGMAFAFLSGRADVFLPLVLAMEAAYLGLLGTHPRFQQYVDAQEAASNRQIDSAHAQQSLAYIMKMLPRELLKRFEDLRTQCLELQHIAGELKNPGKRVPDMPFEQFQVAGLDRLLWIYLRLLYTQYALSRFLNKTNAGEISQDIQLSEQRIKQMPENKDDTRLQRVRKALEDNLETSRIRLDNLSKAKDNYQLVQLEIERLENKIRSLSEMAVNRQEPEFISNQVDHVASSMMETEKTMNDLQFATGLNSLDEQIPELLRAVPAQVVKTR